MSGVEVDEMNFAEMIPVVETLVVELITAGYTGDCKHNAFRKDSARLRRACGTG